MIRFIMQKLCDLWKFYECEKASFIKHAPSLSEKVLFPTNFEPQNVDYAVRLIDEKNISALNMNADASEGTGAFLQLINKWWNIVNVKFPSKGLQ